MLIKYGTADAVRGPYRLDLLPQKSLSVIPQQQRELFLVTGDVTFLLETEKSEEFSVIRAEFSFSQ